MATVKNRPVPRLDVDFKRMGELLYGNLVGMGEEARLQRGFLSNWAISAIRKATEMMLVRKVAIQDIKDNPGAEYGKFAINASAMAVEVDRAVELVTKAILAEAAKQAGKETANV